MPRIPADDPACVPACVADEPPRDHDGRDHCLCDHPPQPHELTPDHALPVATGGVADAPRTQKETA